MAEQRPNARELRQILASRHFLRSWKQLPQTVQRQLKAKISLLACSPAHPSLQAYRLLLKEGVLWGCRLSRSMRLIYQMDETSLWLLDIGKHTIVERLPRRSYLEHQCWTAFEDL